MPGASCEQYFRRFGFYDRQIVEPPAPDLGLVVVIPCYCEFELTAALDALWNCRRPRCGVEVIVVINSPEGCPAAVIVQNQQTEATAREWIVRRQAPSLKVHLVAASGLPLKRAGVGLARKIGMDEALRRLDTVGREEDGVIACFDADCGCDPNYLVEIERHFREHPTTPGCSIYFEHPLEGPLAPESYEAITAYELHLRYYIQALRQAGVPHAFHTVGSAMAVRAGAYQKQGGMNKRPAGEDFYFLHKISLLGGFTNLNSTRVIPSPRASERVPFGTGRAVGNYLAGEPISTYPLTAFYDLKVLFASVQRLAGEADCAKRNGFRDGGAFLRGVTECFSLALREFLDKESFGQALAEMTSNSASLGAFRKRFYAWFDGFRTMKFVHHARDGFYGPGRIEQEPAALLAWRGEHLFGPPSIRQLLQRFRELDRGDCVGDQH